MTPNAGSGSIARGVIHAKPLLRRLPGDAESEPDRRPRMASLPCIGNVSSEPQLCELQILICLDDLADFPVPFGEPLAHSVNVTLTPDSGPKVSRNAGSAAVID